VDAAKIKRAACAPQKGVDGTSYKQIADREGTWKKQLPECSQCGVGIVKSYRPARKIWMHKLPRLGCTNYPAWGMVQHRTQASQLDCIQYTWMHVIQKKGEAVAQSWKPQTQQEPDGQEAAIPR